LAGVVINLCRSRVGLLILDDMSAIAEGSGTARPPSLSLPNMKTLLLLLLCLIAPSLSGAETRVLIVVGPSSHPPGSHEVAAGGRVLRHCLEHMENLPDVKADLVEGWPNQTQREAASSIVFIGDFFPPNRFAQCRTKPRRSRRHDAAWLRHGLRPLCDRCAR
jgi:hypothetical protein